MLISRRTADLANVITLIVVVLAAIIRVVVIAIIIAVGAVTINVVTATIVVVGSGCVRSRFVSRFRSHNKQIEHSHFSTLSPEVVLAQAFIVPKAIIATVKRIVVRAHMHQTDLAARVVTVGQVKIFVIAKCGNKSRQARRWLNCALAVVDFSRPCGSHAKMVDCPFVFTVDVKMNFLLRRKRYKEYCFVGSTQTFFVLFNNSPFLTLIRSTQPNFYLAPLPLASKAHSRLHKMFSYAVYTVQSIVQGC